MVPGPSSDDPMFSIFIPELGLSTSQDNNDAHLMGQLGPGPNSMTQSVWGPQTQHCFLNIQKHVQNEFEDFPAEILNQAGTVGHDGSRNSQKYANSGKLWLNFWFRIIWSIVSPNIPHFATSKMATPTIPLVVTPRFPRPFAAPKWAVAQDLAWRSPAPGPLANVAPTSVGMWWGWLAKNAVEKTNVIVYIMFVVLSKKNWGLWLLMDPNFLHNITDSWLM